MLFSITFVCAILTFTNRRPTYHFSSRRIKNGSFKVETYEPLKWVFIPATWLHLYYWGQIILEGVKTIFPHCIL